MPRIIVERIGDAYTFEGRDEAGKKMLMDTSLDHGGNHNGVSPMQAMLMSLAGCSGIDIVSIMKKQRQNLTGLSMVVDGEREKDKVPALWEKVHVVFTFGGITDIDKARNAVALSIDKYCSVAETLRRAGCTITWDVVLG
jgi:putative redox protein